MLMSLQQTLLFNLLNNVEEEAEKIAVDENIVSDRIAIDLWYTCKKSIRVDLQGLYARRGYV